MLVNLVGCLFVLDSEKNENIRKNDIKRIKVLVDKNGDLPKIIYKGGEMKKEERKNISSIIKSNLFHLEQVFAMENKSSVDIIYLAITNKENIIHLKEDYQLIDFQIHNNNTIVFGENVYPYQTIEVIENNNIEYFHEIDVKNNNLKKNLLSLLISYKKIRSNIDNTDILFKFMGKSFTLEDVRLLYEIVKDSTVDKSNFRKKIIKYCEKTEDEDDMKSGFRPSQKYKFKPLKGDAWL